MKSPIPCSDFVDLKTEVIIAHCEQVIGRVHSIQQHTINKAIDSHWKKLKSSWYHRLRRRLGLDEVTRQQAQSHLFSRDFDLLGKHYLVEAAEETAKQLLRSLNPGQTHSNIPINQLDRVWYGNLDELTKGTWYGIGQVNCC